MEPFEANNNYEESPLVEVETSPPTAPPREWPAIANEMGYDEEAKIGLRVQSRPKDFDSKGILHDRILLVRKMTSPTLLFLVSILLGLDVVRIYQTTTNKASYKLICLGLKFKLVKLVYSCTLDYG